MTRRLILLLPFLSLTKIPAAEPPPFWAAADVKDDPLFFVQAEGGVSRRFGGIGLGLTISRRLALLHGGDIEMESRPGTGTTATFVLPAERIRYSAAFNAPEVACAA